MCDPTRGKGTGTGNVLIENDKIIVTDWSFAPGQNTGWHRHERDYVVVPMLDGKLRIADRDGTNVVEMKSGAPYFREKGVAHDVINASDGDYRFLEIELK